MILIYKNNIISGIFKIMKYIRMPSIKQTSFTKFKMKTKQKIMKLLNFYINKEQRHSSRSWVTTNSTSDHYLLAVPVQAIQVVNPINKNSIFFKIEQET